MLLGRFEKAWEESDRLGLSLRLQARRSDPVVVRCLRGLGDAIQFLRFAPALRRCFATLTIQAPPRLIPLLRHSGCIDSVVSTESHLHGRHELQIER
jgi:hypothetical protein